MRKACVYVVVIALLLALGSGVGGVVGYRIGLQKQSYRDSFFMLSVMLDLHDLVSRGEYDRAGRMIGDTAAVQVTIMESVPASATRGGVMAASDAERLEQMRATLGKLLSPEARRQVQKSPPEVRRFVEKHYQRTATQDVEETDAASGRLSNRKEAEHEHELEAESGYEFETEGEDEDGNNV